MNWEKSKACTPLKRDFLNAFFAKERRFFLTGGSALGLFYLDHRRSYDLDFFTPENLDWLEVDGLARLCASEIQTEIHLLREAPTFRRYQLRRDDQNEIVDFVIDLSPQIDPLKCWVGNIYVDTLREITANKLTTLLSRCELKDIVDLYFLEQGGLRIEDVWADALQKDGGLDAGMIALLLDSVDLTALPDFMIKPLSLPDLRDYIDNLKKRMAILALPGSSS
jgi:hypothetical protein